MEDGNDYLVHNSLIQNPQESSGHKKSESKKKEKENINSGHSGMNGTEIAKPVASPEQVERLKGEITAQGDKVRNLKSSGAGKVKSCINYLSKMLWLNLQKICQRIGMTRKEVCPKILEKINLLKTYERMII